VIEERREAMLIIGAGPCGLAHAKALKEAGIAYEQVEADRDVGGNWYHGVYRTVHIISSRRTTEFADYPMPADYPDFPSGQQILDYMRAYAREFELYPKIEFNTKVVMVSPRADELWDVELSSGERRTYKGVLVCNGHHWQKRFPKYEGEFTGDVLHSKDYKGPEQLTGKRVLIIGGGNSACDVASEAARVAETSHISLRRGYWFMPKTLLGKPIVESPVMHLPVWTQRLILRALIRLVVGRYEDYGLPRPDHKIFEKHPTISTEILHYLKHGRIKPRPDVARFEGRMVHFTNGTRTEFDMIVCATGYYVSFPFLPEGMVPVKNGNLAMLYAGCVLPEYKHLYVIGTRQTRYGIGPLLTPGSKLIAKMIQLQDEMELPLGLVMKASGARLPTTHLVNPIQALRQMRMARYTMPLLLKRERRLRKKLKPQRAMQTELTLSSNPDLQVY
jgi:hypothetical protein